MNEPTETVAVDAASDALSSTWPGDPVTGVGEDARDVEFTRAGHVEVTNPGDVEVTKGCTYPRGRCNG